MFFSKKPVLARKIIYLAFFDMFNGRHMYSKHDRKIVCGMFGPMQPKFLFVAPVRLFVEFLLYEKIHGIQ